MDYTNIKAPKPISGKRLPTPVPHKIEITTATRFGGFWIRLLAQFVDQMILLSLGVFIVMVICLIDPAAFDGDGHGPSLAFVGSMYCAFFTASKYMGTPGKMAFGLAVVNQDGSQLTQRQAFGRYFAYIISFLTLGVGYLMIAFHPKKQGLHDLICKTFVIKRKSWPVFYRILVITGPILITLVCLLLIPADKDEVAMEKTETLAADQKYDEAMPILDDLIARRCGKKHDFWFDCAGLLSNRGYIYELRGTTNAAYADYSRIIELEPNDAEGYRLRGYLSYTEGDGDKALQDLNKALQVDPSDTQSYFYRAIINYGSGHYESALADTKSAKQQSDSNPYFENTGEGTPYAIFTESFPQPGKDDVNNVYHQILALFGK